MLINNKRKAKNQMNMNVQSQKKDIRIRKGVKEINIQQKITEN